MKTEIKVGDKVCGGARYHVTAIRNGGVYGHDLSHCDGSGCNGDELYLRADSDEVTRGEVIDSEDYDEGRVESIDGEAAIVAWDSGVKTPANLSALRLLAS